MFPFKCSLCGTRPKIKMAQLYWAWFRADGVRTAWKQRLCVDCTSDSVASLLAHSSDASEDFPMCPSCGTNSSEDLDPIYLTLFVPKFVRSDLHLTTCASCAVEIRSKAQTGAEKLENRSGFAEDTSATSPWDALGLARQT